MSNDAGRLHRDQILDHLEREYNSLRKEIENKVQETVKLELYIIISIGIFYAYYNHTSPTAFLGRLVLAIPVLLSVLGMLKKLALDEHIQIIGCYLRTVEKFLLNPEDPAVARPCGWENWFYEHKTKKIQVELPRDSFYEFNNSFWIFIVIVTSILFILSYLMK